jgi:hypothetical protein
MQVQSIQSKAITAKLLATENISVEHKKVSTAYFDVKNRVMVLPIWKDMTPELYDLLQCHEIGHALETPAEGWHNSVKDQTKKGFKTYLNVVEDARIEKLVVRRYPGVRTSFRKGYTTLHERDFFGIHKNSWDIDTLPLIDRINLHYKIGAFLNVRFELSEMHFLDKIDSLETWDDTVRVAQELYEYGKEEAKLKDLEMVDYQDDMDFEDDDSDWEEGEDGDSKEKTLKGRQTTSGYEHDPESMTDKFFRSMEQNLVDDSVKPYIYVNCPTPKLDRIIIPYKNVAKFYNEFRYHDYSLTDEQIEYNKSIAVPKAKEYVYRKFQDTNKKYIGYLVKEFELRRNAKQFARASTAKTGKLNMKKIFQYKLNDDLFKRMTVVPQGKSHGLLMYIDYSGSMSDSINATIEQTVVLASFCRKVNIPFRVYAFVDSLLESALRNKELGKNHTDESDFWADETVQNKFSKNPNELCLDAGFRLREYLSSDMSSTEFKDAVKYWLLVGALFQRRIMRRSDPSFDQNIAPELNLSNFEMLNGTPLNEAIISAIEITKEFKDKHRLDIVNTVFLTDGESNDRGSVYGERGNDMYYDKYNNDCNVIVRHTKTMAEGKKVPGADLTVALLELLRNVTNTKAIGFFISPYYGRGVIQNRIRKAGKYIDDFDTKYKQAKRDKFFMLTDCGYDDYYIIPGGKALEIEEDKMDVEVGAKKSDLKNAFMKMQKNKSINRILLDRFVSKIA